MRTAALLVCFTTTVLSSGCGTMLNLSNERVVYGGTIFEAKLGCVAVADAAEQSGLFGMPEAPPVPKKFHHWTETLIVCCAMIDLPATAVLDTLTLPITVYSAIDKMLATLGRPRSPTTRVDSRQVRRASRCLIGSEHRLDGP